MELEVISRLPSAERAVKRHPAPRLFVHGAWHAAWCWARFFLDYFASQGLEAHALSLRGHGGSQGRDGLRWARLADLCRRLCATDRTALYRQASSILTDLQRACEAILGRLPREGRRGRNFQRTV